MIKGCRIITLLSRELGGVIIGAVSCYENLLSHTSRLHNNYNFEDDFYVGEDRKPYDKEQFFKNMDD